MTNTALLYTLLDKSGYKLQHVAYVLQMTPQTLRRKLNGQADFKLCEAERLSALLQMTVTERELCFFSPPRAQRPVPKPERRSADDTAAAHQNQGGPAPVWETVRQSRPGAESMVERH